MCPRNFSVWSLLYEKSHRFTIALGFGGVGCASLALTYFDR